MEQQRGGVLVSVTNKFNLPIYRIGLGEKIDDLEIFDPKLFSKGYCWFGK